MMILSNNTYKDFFLNDAVVAGTDVSPVESAEINCLGQERIRVQLMIGATAAQNGTVKFYIEESALPGGAKTLLSGATIGTHTHAASGETAKIYEIDAPVNYRYVKIVYQREAANTALLCGTYELYNSNTGQVGDQSATIKERVVVN